MLTMNSDTLVNRIVIFFLKYSFKYIATIFLMWSFIFIFIIILMGFISTWGTPKIPHFIIVYFESNFQSGINGTIILKHKDLLLIFMQIVLVFEILNELIKFAISKYCNLVGNQCKKTRKEYFGRFGADTRIITIVFSGSSILLIIGNRLDISVLSKITSIFILYALSLIFIKIYKTLDNAADNLVVSP